MGGFFTLGVNLGYKSFLTENLFFDTSIHFGGGGGAGAPDGGGAFILPKVNLGYQFDKFALSAGYSYVNFLTVVILLVINLMLDFKFQ